MIVRYGQIIVADTQASLLASNAQMGDRGFAIDTKLGFLYNGTSWIVSANSILFTQTADAVVSNSTTDLSSMATGVGVYADRTLPAGFWTPGKTVRVKGGGIYTTPLTSNITTKIKLGSSVIATSNTNALLNQQTNMRWTFEVTITCRTVGTTGSFMVVGELLFDVGQTAPATQFIGTNVTTPETANNTIAGLFDITNAWDTATATRSVTTRVATVEALN